MEIHRGGVGRLEVYSEWGPYFTETETNNFRTGRRPGLVVHPKKVFQEVPRGLSSGQERDPWTEPTEGLTVSTTDHS